MKNYLLLLLLFVAGSTNAQTRGDSIFYQFNPRFISLKTQKLIVNEILSCFAELGAPDTFSLYDRYYTGWFNDLNSEAGVLLSGPLDSLDAEFPQDNLLVKWNQMALQTKRSAMTDFSAENAYTLEGTDQTDFLDDQLYSVFGNLSEEYFINTFDEIPKPLQQQMIDYGARKMAWYAATGQDIFAEARLAPDSTDFLLRKLNTPLFLEGAEYAQYANRLLLYYLLYQEDTISQIIQNSDLLATAQTAYQHSDTLYVKHIDELGLTASTAYRNYRDSAMLQFARDMATITANTETNLGLLEEIQNILVSELAHMDDLEAQLQNAPGDSLNLAFEHLNALIKNLAGANLINQYLNGDLDPAQWAADLRAAGVTNPAIFDRMGTMQAKDDIWDVVSVTRTLGHIGEGFQSPAFISGAVIASGTAIGVAKYFYNMVPPITKKAKVSNIAIRTKKLINERKNMLKKFGAKSLFKLGTNLVTGFVKTAILGDLISDLITGPILEEMNRRFDVVDEKLDHIMEVQIEVAEQLMDGIQANRELMQYNFNNVNLQLAQIMQNQAQASSLLESLLKQDLSSCVNVYDEILENDLLSKYSDLEFIYRNQPGANDCIEGLFVALQNTINDPDCANLDFFIHLLNDNPSEYVQQEVSAFGKTATLFEWLYGSGSDAYEKAQQLLIETESTFDEPWQNSKLTGEELDFHIDPAKLLDETKYIDVFNVSAILKYYELLYSYYEVFETSADNSPKDLGNYLALTEKERRTRLNNVKRQIDNFRCVSDLALAQQALMSGRLLLEPVYAIIFKNAYQDQMISYKGNDVELRRFCIDLLRSNPTFASNFMTYVIRKNFGMDVHYPAQPNRVFQGNFDYGDRSFETDLEYRGVGGPIASYISQYTFIDTLPGGFIGAGFSNRVDHTSGKGMYLLGGPTSELPLVWEQSLVLEGGRAFAIKAWVAPAVTYPTTIAIKVNEDSLASIMLGSEIPLGEWQAISTTFTPDKAGVFSLSIVLSKESPSQSVRIMLDDISVEAVDSNRYAPKNLRSELFFNYAYDQTPNITYPGDTFMIDDTHLLGVDTAILETYALVDSLDFKVYEYPNRQESMVYLYLQTDANCQIIGSGPSGIACEAALPIPPRPVISEDKFIYTEAYTQLSAVKNRLDHLRTYIYLPSYYDNDWQKLQMYKVILMNRSNQ